MIILKTTRMNGHMKTLKNLPTGPNEKYACKELPVATLGGGYSSWGMTEKALRALSDVDRALMQFVPRRSTR